MSRIDAPRAFLAGGCPSGLCGSTCQPFDIYSNKLVAHVHSKPAFDRAASRRPACTHHTFGSCWTRRCSSDTASLHTGTRCLGVLPTRSRRFVPAWQCCVVRPPMRSPVAKHDLWRRHVLASLRRRQRCMTGASRTVRASSLPARVRCGSRLTPCPLQDR
jgi:hypothetical protein